MKYVKPEVLQSTNAVEAIESQQGVKGSPSVDAIIDERPVPSTGAYESDE